MSSGYIGISGDDYFLWWLIYGCSKGWNTFQSWTKKWPRKIEPIIWVLFENVKNDCVVGCSTPTKIWSETHGHPLWHSSCWIIDQFCFNKLHDCKKTSLWWCYWAPTPTDVLNNAQKCKTFPQMSHLKNIQLLKMRGRGNFFTPSLSLLLIEGDKHHALISCHLVFSSFWMSKYLVPTPS